MIFTQEIQKPIFPASWLELETFTGQELHPADNDPAYSDRPDLVYLVESVTIGVNTKFNRDSMQIAHEYFLPGSIAKCKTGKVVKKIKTTYEVSVEKFTDVKPGKFPELREGLISNFPGMKFVIKELNLWTPAFEKLKLAVENVAHAGESRKMRMTVKEFRGVPVAEGIDNGLFDYNDLDIATEGLTENSCKINLVPEQTIRAQRSKNCRHAV